MFTSFRALKTLPTGFIIKNSNIPQAGLGVFADSFVRRETWLGEYHGYIVKVEKQSLICHNSSARNLEALGRYIDFTDGYAWEVNI